MSTMPLGLLGAVVGLIVLGFPFGFTSFAGLISMCGMVVRSGIIFIDYAEDLRRKQQLTPFEVAFAAGKRRLRPIFLTSAAASVGVIPMILRGSPLWGPLATVICFGLIASTLLGIFVQPAAYLLLIKSKGYKEGNQ
jgi:multidrug efflux pump subunit AcrB